jgi:uncharacterized protein YegP (UPF0339 family)
LTLEEAERVMEKEHVNRFVIYRDRGVDYSWRLRSPTGETLAASPSGHRDKAACEAEVRDFNSEYPEAEILDPTAKRVAE